MKPSLFLIALFLFLSSAFSQDFTVQQGNEFKMPKKFSNPQLVGNDETGLYFITFREKRKYAQADFSDKIYSILKYDKSFNPLYEYEFDKDLDGSEVFDIKQLKGRLFLFSILTRRKEDTYTILCSELDKTSGKIIGPLKELGTYPKEFKYDYYDIGIKPNFDSTNVITVVGTLSEKFQRFDIRTFDLTLKQISKINFAPGKDRDLLYIDDVFITSNNTTIVATGNFEYVQITKKKKKKIFKDYTITALNDAGKALFTVTSEIKGKSIVSGKIAAQKKDEIIIAGLYSNTSDKKEINGVYLDKYHLLTGKLISSSTKELSPDIFNRMEKEKKFDANQDESTDGISNSFEIRSIHTNPLNNTPVIIAEIFDFSSYMVQSTFNGKMDFTTYTTAINSDLMIIETDQNGMINRISGLPKTQIEKMVLTSSLTATANQYARTGLFFYSSFASFIYNNKMILIVNDNSGNARTLKIGDAVKPASDMSQSAAYALTFDFSTGTFSRKFLFTNSGQPIAVTREGMLVGNEYIMYARFPPIIGKMEYKLIKVVIK